SSRGRGGDLRDPRDRPPERQRHGRADSGGKEEHESDDVTRHRVRIAPKRIARLGLGPAEAEQGDGLSRDASSNPPRRAPPCLPSRAMCRDASVARDGAVPPTLLRLADAVLGPSQGWSEGHERWRLRYAAVAATVAVVIVVRRFDAITTPQFWAEDGSVYF